MDEKKVFNSKIFNGLILGVMAIIIILLVFAAGMFIGFRKADFSYQWGENYHRNFAGPRGGFMQNFSGRDFIDAHGTFGQVIQNSSSTLTIKSNDGAEKNILINASTVIRKFRDEIKISDINIGDNLVIIGDPDQSGQIQANLIRLMPPPPTDNLPPLNPQPQQ
ncbi:MAG: hypothetical protein WCP18_02290 [bacterium]